MQSNQDKAAHFIEKAEKLHGKAYDYSEVEYINNKVKVMITCQNHGVFWQQPSNHLQGQGCPKCGKLRAGRKLASSCEDFIQKSVKFHGNAFDYSRVNYIRNSDEVEIRCIRHDSWFKQLPATHLKYNGCSKCRSEKLSVSNLKTTEEFIETSRRRHGEKYDYTKSIYKSFSDKVEIICPLHGSFWQAPFQHSANGQGCPSCARGGYSPQKVGTLYVLTYENVTKVGITNFSAKDRLAYINPRSPYEFKVYKEYTNLDGLLCEDTEREILDFLRSKYESPTDKFHGYTESFFNVDRDELLYLLDNKLNKI